MNILKKIVVISLYSILATPLLVWGAFLFPFISPKTFFFRAMIEIILFFYILLVISQPKYRPYFSKLTWAVFVYVLIMTFTSIFGVNAYNSFWGNIERGEGLLTIYHIFIFFVIITSVFKSKKEWLNFFSFSVLISLLMSFYALIQKYYEPIIEFLSKMGGFGLRIINFLNKHFLLSSGGNRLTGTIGNASFMAAYLLLHIFLCLFLLANKKGRNWRLVCAAAILFEIYILFQTETRGAILGLIVGLLLMSFLIIVFLQNKKIKKGFAVLSFILIVLSLFIWLCRDKDWVINNSALNRLTRISFDDITTQSRLLGWQAAWRGWRDKFFLGYGYENYNVAFNKYFPAQIYRDAGSQIWFDRSHNIIFDQAVTGGIAGLLAYLGIFIAAFKILWLRRHSKEETSIQNNKFGLIILVSLLSAYLFQNLFVFDTLGTYISFYFILGYISFLALDLNSVNSFNGSIVAKKNSSQLNPFLVFVLILTLIFNVYVFNIKPARANYLSTKAMIFAYNSRYRDALVEFKKALSYKTYQSVEIRQNLYNITIEAIKSNQFNNQEIEESYSYTLNELKKNVEKFSSDARQYLFLMKFYNDSLYLNPENVNEIIILGQKALELSPTRPQFYTLMGQAKINSGKYSEGIDYFQKALELSLKVVESRWSLAVAYIIASQNDLAEKEFLAMKELGFEYYSEENLNRIAKVYLAVKNFDQLFSIYSKLIELSPNNSYYYIKLAVVCGESGRKEEAEKAARKAAELDSSLRENVEIFIKSLQ